MSVNSSFSIKKQQGLALLILVVVIALAFVTYTVSELSITKVKVEQIKNTQIALKEAKQALLNYAVLSVNNEPGYYGFLPCPDVGVNAISEGGSHSTCDSKKVNTIGLFPWASLETGVLSSYSGDCFWYAVSGEYKAVLPPPSAFSSRTEMLNEDTNGSFKVYESSGVIKAGANPEDRVVAVIFNPATALTGQSRSIDAASHCGLDYVVTEYLEGDGIYDNATISTVALGVDEVINRGVDTDKLPIPFNDELITITRKELWRAVLTRNDFFVNADSSVKNLTEALALCITEYGKSSNNKKLPRPAVVDFLGQDYRIDSNYDDATVATYLGRYPYIVDDSDTTLSAVNAPNNTEPVLFDKGFCNSLTLMSGTNINLETTTNSEEYIMWKNWKDHFFYAVSDYYDPDNVAVAATAPPHCDGTNCIIVGGVEYAGVVLFSGSRTGAQVRNEPIAGDSDTKNNLNNYLELVSLGGTGRGDHTPTGNDIVFCITDTDPFTVVNCN